MNLNHKNILITGGSIGIGLELAKQLSSEGARVLICARNIKPLEKAKNEYPKLEIAKCDVTDIGQVEQLVAKAESLFGGIDVLINNAAVFRRFDILSDYPLQMQLEEIDINLKGPVILTNSFLEMLLKRREAMVVNLTSPAAYMPMAASQIYSATKSAIQSWTKSLRHQLKDTKVKVVELNPPAVDTRMNKNNPGVEGFKLMSAEEFARRAVRGIKKGKNEILVGDAGIVKQLSRFVPGMTFKMLNKG